MPSPRRCRLQIAQFFCGPLIGASRWFEKLWLATCQTLVQKLGRGTPDIAYARALDRRRYLDVATGRKCGEIMDTPTTPFVEGSINRSQGCSPRIALGYINHPLQCRVDWCSIFLTTRFLRQHVVTRALGAFTYHHNFDSIGVLTFDELNGKTTNEVAYHATHNISHSQYCSDVGHRPSR